MEIKILFIVLLSLLLFTNVVSLNGHQVLSSHDLVHGHAMPRKLMFTPKVEGFEDSATFVSDDEDLSASKVTTKEGTVPSRMFTMDYSPVRKRRPVHNK